MTTFPFSESDNYYAQGKAYAHLYINRLPNPGDVLIPSPRWDDAGARDYAAGLDYSQSDAFWTGWDCAFNAARDAYWRVSSGL